MALALNILRHEQMLAVIDDIAEVADPIAQYYNASFLCELKIHFNMPMAIDEIVNV